MEGIIYQPSCRVVTCANNNIAAGSSGRQAVEGQHNRCVKLVRWALQSGIAHLVKLRNSSAPHTNGRNWRPLFHDGMGYPAGRKLDGADKGTPKE
jgi:hypothetical protein